MTVPTAEHLDDLDPLHLRQAAPGRDPTLLPPDRDAADAPDPTRPLIDWAPTGALGGWGGDPWWPPTQDP